MKTPLITYIPERNKTYEEYIDGFGKPLKKPKPPSFIEQVENILCGVDSGVDSGVDNNVDDKTLSHNTSYDKFSYDNNLDNTIDKPHIINAAFLDRHSIQGLGWGVEKNKRI